MTSKDNYCVIMGGGIGSRFCRLAARQCLNSFWISLVQVVRCCSKPSIDSIKLFLRRTYLL